MWVNEHRSLVNVRLPSVTCVASLGLPRSNLSPLMVLLLEWQKIAPRTLWKFSNRLLLFRS